MDKKSERHLKHSFDQREFDKELRNYGGVFSFILYISLFSKNFYDDHNFYKIKKISPGICTIEKKW